MIDVAGNWRQAQERVRLAAHRAGRDPAAVRIIAVSKTQPVEAIEQVIAAGATDIGENYVQEAAAKMARIAAPVRWHLIGHLQRNKAARAAGLFDMIHTLDSVALGEVLARQGDLRQRAVRVLIEVNIASEATKSGVLPEQTQALLTALAKRQGLRIEGLMAVPPAAGTAEAARPHFRALCALRDRLVATCPDVPLCELSMGMTDDFEVAIEEGATIVRIGRAIFGERGKEQVVGC
jgi:PLP dependent protein